MAKYRVFMEHIITSYAEVEVEAESYQEAVDAAWDLYAKGDIDFEPDSEPTFEITDVDLVEDDAD